MGPSNMTDAWCPDKKWTFGHRHTHSKAMWRDIRACGLSKPRREAWDRASPHDPQRTPALQTP